MRAMILAAGQGTRLLPLSNLRPKPAMPVRGIPLIAYTLRFLAAHGVEEVVINLHHLPDVLRNAAERYCPEGIELRFSFEQELLDTGGGIRRVASFLRESDPCLILGGDMILDVDLTALVERHRERGDRATLLLLDDPRAASFGTIGVDRQGGIRRIAGRLDLGGESARGLYVWANVVSPRLFDSMPDSEVSVYLDDWIGRLASQGADDVRGEVLRPDECTWEPVGTLPEYLRVNLDPPDLSFMNADLLAEREGTRFGASVVLGAGSTVGKTSQLERVVVWDGEKVPDGLKAHEGVYAGGDFHPCSWGEDGT